MSYTITPKLVDEGLQSAPRGAHSAEVAAGKRFEFGANWAAFLRQLTPQRVELAVHSLQQMLGLSDLRGKRFLDIGSGSGLFSLAARRLGASVRSFDYDPQSVQCTRELKQRYFADDPDWTIEEGSILDPHYLQSLGRFEIVYSWGVLHHTGSMWTAIGNAATLVAAHGTLFIAIYNDNGASSRWWRSLKRLYNRAPAPLRPLYIMAVFVPRELRSFLGNMARGTPSHYFGLRRRYAEKSTRGMSYWRDFVDWVGGYPYEVARPEEVFRFCRTLGFRLTEFSTCVGGLGCNEFVFRSAGRDTDG